MPFQSPWRDYQKGDLFYGLAESRRDLIVHLGLNPKDLNTIDQHALYQAEASSGSGLTYDKGFIDALEQLPEYQWVAGKRMMWDAKRGITGHPNIDFPVVASAIARVKSKGGLDYITRSTVYHIHFCLDDIEMGDVPAKTYDRRDLPQGKSNRPAADKVRSITGSELRWVYRNRGDPIVAAKIQFWFNNARCAPPWDVSQSQEWRNAWAAYHPTHEF